jgi:hypothetical protein
MISIRHGQHDDHDELWRILREVVQSAGTYANCANKEWVRKPR